MELSARGLKMIQDHEGLRLQAYRDPVGIMTIGYGHIATAHEGMTITHQQAMELLLADVRRFEDAVDRLVEVPINQNHYDALVSFAFNLGSGALSRSTLLRKLNAGDYRGAANEFGRWVNAGGRELPGLVRRRHEERDLFLTPASAPASAPTHWYDEIDTQ